MESESPDNMANVLDKLCLNSLPLMKFKKIVKSSPSAVDERDHQGNSILHLAASVGRQDILRWLFTGCHVEEADCLVGNNVNETCAEVATKEAQLGCLKVIIKYSKSKRIFKRTLENGGGTLLHLATSAGHLAIVKWLLKQEKVLAKSLDHDGRTPLHLAVLMGFGKITKAIASAAYSSRCLRDNFGATPLYYAATEGHVDCLFHVFDDKSLLSVNPRTGLTPMHVASENGYLEIVEFFANKMCRHCLQNLTLDGSTVFHIAAEKGHHHILKLLLNRKGGVAAAQTLDKNGYSPLQLAAMFNHPHCSELLRNIGSLARSHVPLQEFHEQTNHTKSEVTKRRDPVTGPITRGRLTPSLYHQKNRPSPLSFPDKKEEVVLEVERSLDESIDVDSIDWTAHSPLAVIQDYNGFLHGSRKSLGSADWDDINSNFILKERSTYLGSDCSENDSLSVTQLVSYRNDSAGSSENVSSCGAKLFTLELNEVPGGDFFKNKLKEDYSCAEHLQGEPFDYAGNRVYPINAQVIVDCDLTNKDNQKLIYRSSNDEEESMAQNNNQQVPKIEADNNSGQNNVNQYPVSPGASRRTFRLDYGAYTKNVLTRRETKSRVPILYTDERVETSEKSTSSATGKGSKNPHKTVIKIGQDE